jgi:type I restriction enzyme R subunit
MLDAQLSADNIRYFGEPVYEYDMAEGIEDGYLAGCEIQKGRVNLDDTGIHIEDILARNPVDANTGDPISREYLQDLYEKTQYEDRILLPDRVMAMCRDLFQYLRDSGGPEQKTIIFCVRDRHADDVAVEMNNLYARWCTESGWQRLEPYAFKCTASVHGSDYLADLWGASRSHFVATTVDLLTTGQEGASRGFRVQERIVVVYTPREDCGHRQGSCFTIRTGRDRRHGESTDFSDSRSDAGRWACSPETGGQTG